ncbi:PH domain-containing protein [Actinocrispum sp. NPDC049592]|uniref:PH domain-containing protein n=1 Tax=Actinocrispum sp. NPDC049592 TaxID=3154835 RepID=UPI0034216BDD
MRIRPPRNRLSPRFIVWRTLNTFFWALFVIGLFVVPYLIWEDARTWLGPVIWFLVAVFGVNILFMPTYRYYVHRWETTDDAVYTLTGWISREWRIVPISRIQSIDTVQGPIEQMLKLATVKVTTAAAGRHGVTIEGLDAELAKEAVRRLNEITQATPGDAT